MLACFLCVLPSGYAKDQAVKLKPRDGKSLYRNCVACHGEQGEGNYTIKAPAIAGLEEWYVVKQLHNFQKGIRANHKDDARGLQMRPMSRLLRNDEEIKSVAEYISKELKAKEPEKTLSDKEVNIAKGATLYQKHCVACHMPSGKGSPGVYPSLLGLNDWYIFSQTKKIMEKVRGQHKDDTAKLMYDQIKNSGAELTDQDYKDITAYITQDLAKKAKD